MPCLGRFKFHFCVCILDVAAVRLASDRPQVIGLTILDGLHEASVYYDRLNTTEEAVNGVFISA